MQKTILQRIQALDALSEAEIKVAHYYESGYPLSLSHSINQVSQTCAVSVATVSRFIRRLGYESFYDLKAEANTTLETRLTSPIERYAKRPRKKNQLEGGSAYLEACIANLSETAHRIDAADFARAVEILVRAKRLFVIGAASASALASYFAIFARYARPGVIALAPDISTLPHALADVGKDDALLAITHYRFSRVTSKIGRFFHAQGAPLVLLTDRNANPLTSVATVTLSVVAENMPLFNSRVATLALLEALFNGMLPFCEKTIKSRFAVMEELFDTLGVYSNE